MRRDIQTLLNSTYIRKLIRTDVSPTEFRFASAQVADAFEQSGDRLQSSTSYIGALLERGVRVLLYAGTLDMMCGAVANERTSRVVEWSGQEEFSGTAMREWEVEGKVAGEVRSMGMLTYASVYRAGHMVSR
jgi:carboxypeptidase C (cathepsin A)